MVDVIAHRANSPSRLAGISAAGAGWVEIDAASGPGGELVASHDPGARGVRLAGLLALASGEGLRVTVDLKCPPALVPAACEAISASGLARGVLVCGHYERPWSEIRALLPTALLGWSAPQPTRWQRALRRGAMQRELASSAPALLEAKGLDVLLAHHSLVGAALAGALHAEGKLLHAWTVNRAGQARRLARLGVDAIVTDRPREIAAVLASP